MGLLDPDRYYARLSCIDIQQDLLACGLSHVLLDIDNTILSRQDHQVPRDVALWLGQARDAGVKFCLVSNNWHQGVHQLAQSLELPLVAKALKPFPFALWRASSLIGGTPRTTVMIGDQLFTDIVAGHLAGMKAFLLLPLAEQDLRHTLILRNLERSLLGKRQPEPAAWSKASECSDEGVG